MKIQGYGPWGAAVIAAVLLVGCAGREKKYQVGEQTPARHITPERSAADAVEYDEAGCARPGRVEGAGAFLDAILSFGERRTGTQAFRCVEAWARDELRAMGYDVEELVYPFPYYEFDLAATRVVRVRDGAEFKAHPMHFSPPASPQLTGRVCRPRPDLTGCFVYVNPEEWGTGDVKEKYEKWKERGALGTIREATLKPESGRGHRHPAMAHYTSWHYAPLPGFVVENARELIGETITAASEARIVRGTGRTLVAKGPAPSGKYVVITAHLDCWFAGALDDGSGSAALLEAARLMKDDPQGILFLLVDTEEPGILGSAAFVQRFDLGRVDSIIELDMVSGKNNFGRNKTPETAGPMPRLITVEGGVRPAAKKYLKALPGYNFLIPVGLAEIAAGGIRTDMQWFYERGVPGVFIYVPSRYYHTELDTRDWIADDDLQAVAQAVADLARHFRSEPPAAPEEIIHFEFTAGVGEGGTVEFEVSGDGLSGLAKVSVNCYFELGFEKKVELKRGDDGVYRGGYRPGWPGEWQFLAAVSNINKHGKKWAVLNVGRE